jgi:hypothetical protein
MFDKEMKTRFHSLAESLDLHPNVSDNFSMELIEKRDMVCVKGLRQQLIDLFESIHVRYLGVCCEYFALECA